MGLNMDSSPSPDSSTTSLILKDFQRLCSQNSKTQGPVVTLPKVLLWETFRHLSYPEWSHTHTHTGWLNKNFSSASYVVHYDELRNAQKCALLRCKPACLTLIVILDPLNPKFVGCNTVWKSIALPGSSHLNWGTHPDTHATHMHTSVHKLITVLAHPTDIDME